MKQFSVLFIFLVSCVFSCKKNPDGFEPTPALKASAPIRELVEKDTGIRPNIMVSLSTKKLKGSPLLGWIRTVAQFYNSRVLGNADSAGEPNCAMTILETLSTLDVFVLWDKREKDPDIHVYARLTGLRSDSALACMSQGDPEMKPDKIQGVDVLVKVPCRLSTGLDKSRAFCSRAFS